MDRAVREAGVRIRAALAVRYRDLDIAEDAFAEACARAARAWAAESPANPAAWLYRAADRVALDLLRRSKVRVRFTPDLPPPDPDPEDSMLDEVLLIPDDRLRLIFVCCHPAVAPEARVALTLKVVCGLETAEIARAFLVSETTLAQRLVRAKRKIAEAGVPFEVPGPDLWRDRLEAVLSTIEIAYSKAHEDAAREGAHAGYAAEVLELTRLLIELTPDEPEAHALAATVRYAEARRPARLDASGAMTPLSEQDPKRWTRSLIDEADACLIRTAAFAPLGPRALQAAIHGAWCRRRSLTDPPPWRAVLTLYDTLLLIRDDPVVRLNRAVALAEVAGADVALSEVDLLDAKPLATFPPYHAVRADLLRRLGRIDEARIQYAALLALDPAPAERKWIERQEANL